MNDKKIKFVFSVANGAIGAIIFIMAITIAADLILPIKDWLKNIFSHHWVGKSILSLVLFILFFVISYFSPIRPNIEGLKNRLYVLIWFSMISPVLIFLFFIWEAFIK